MSHDAILVYAVFGKLTLQHGGGYGGKLTTDLFELHLILIMTFALLISSYTCGIAIYYMRQEKQNLMMFWMIITVIPGLVFVGFEIYEFAHYASEGVNPTIGSFWSSFFILLGTHGARIIRYCLGYLFVNSNRNSWFGFIQCS